MITTRTPWFTLHSPEIGRAFQEFADLCNEDGVLDRKTKAILMLAAASLLQRDDCIEDRLRQAFEAGATKAEITETLLIMAFQSAEAQVGHESDLFRKYLGGSNGHLS
jgi:alkylhydroperoxidase/carboxymuconolactone decarboxylase family protein YurZ